MPSTTQIMACWCALRTGVQQLTKSVEKFQTGKFGSPSWTYLELLRAQIAIGSNQQSRFTDNTIWAEPVTASKLDTQPRCIFGLAAGSKALHGKQSLRLPNAAQHQGRRLPGLIAGKPLKQSRLHAAGFVLAQTQPADQPVWQAFLQWFQARETVAPMNSLLSDYRRKLVEDGLSPEARMGTYVGYTVRDYTPTHSRDGPDEGIFAGRCVLGPDRLLYEDPQPSRLR